MGAADASVLNSTAGSWHSPTKEDNQPAPLRVSVMQGVVNKMDNSYILKLPEWRRAREGPVQVRSKCACCAHLRLAPFSSGIAWATCFGMRAACCKWSRCPRKLCSVGAGLAAA